MLTRIHTKGRLTNHMKRKNPCQDKRFKIETIAKKLIEETDNNIINTNMSEQYRIKNSL